MLAIWLLFEVSTAKYILGYNGGLFGNSSCGSEVTAIEVDSLSNLLVCGWTYCQQLQEDQESLCSEPCSSSKIPFLFREERGKRIWTHLLNSDY